MPFGMTWDEVDEAVLRNTRRNVRNVRRALAENHRSERLARSDEERRFLREQHARLEENLRRETRLLHRYEAEDTENSVRRE